MTLHRRLGSGFVVLGIAFVVPALALLVFEPRMGFATAQDYFDPLLARKGWDSTIWAIADLTEIVYSLVLILIAACLNSGQIAADRLSTRCAGVTAAGAAGLFLLVGLIGIVAVDSATLVAARGAALTDSSLASVIVIRSVLRVASVFMLGLFLMFFLLLARSEKLLHPLVILLGIFPAGAALAMPWLLLPAPLLFVPWFLLAGVNMLVT
ncbi:MAG: hypothetical protein R3F41_05420 [Gammaproteobacteria bacterium]|nr:hypothetical protein [Pseudomonadales bacterium]MCP5345256.1 hypothetical protein [Pseudomonadales bacterium]